MVSPAGPSGHLCKIEEQVQGPGKAVDAIAVSPDGKWLASGGDDDNAPLWRARAQ